MTSKKKTAKKAVKASKQKKEVKARKPRKSKVKNEQQEPQAEVQTASIEEFNSTVDTSFFYTNDKQLNAIDDGEIIQKIISKYPSFVQSSKDTLLRKTFLEFLDDRALIDEILQYYNLTILDLFKIVYKQYSALFNTLFIKKVREKVKSYEYYGI